MKSHLDLTETDLLEKLKMHEEMITKTNSQFVEDYHREEARKIRIKLNLQGGGK